VLNLFPPSAGTANLECAQDKAGTPADVSLEAPVESDGRSSEDRMLIIAISWGAVVRLPNLARSVRRHSASRAIQAANTTSPSKTVPRPTQPGAAALESEAVPLVLVGSFGTESNAVDGRVDQRRSPERLSSTSSGRVVVRARTAM
jgi:hypothetical protein